MKNITIAILAMFVTINVFATSSNVKMTSLQKKSFDIITKYEGWRSSTYTCPAGKKTIGWGFTSPEFIRKGSMTRNEADKILVNYIDGLSSYLDGQVQVKLTENQKAALISFVYNIGRGNFEKSTMLKKINKKDFGGAASEFAKWNKSKGKVLSGLTSRRADERALFCK